MRTVYAVEFDVAAWPGDAHAAQPARVLAHDLQCYVWAWVSKPYTTTTAKWPKPAYGQLARPARGHEILMTQEINPEDDACIYTTRWTRPLEGDERTLMHATCEVAQIGNAVEFSIVLRLEASEFVIAPRYWSFEPPDIVPKLIRDYRCMLGNRELSHEAAELTRHTIRKFTEQSLFSSDRRLPIVLVSPARHTGEYFVSASELAHTLAGLAEVYTLTEESSFSLTQSVGKLYSCFNGAVRLYYPGFNADVDAGDAGIDGDDLRQSYLYMGDKVLEQGFTSQLFRWLASMAALGFAPGLITLMARDAVQRYKAREQTQRQQDYEHLRERMKDQPDYAALWQQSDEGWERERRDNSTLRQRIRELEFQLQSLRENISSIARSRPPADALGTSECDPTTVSEAVICAERSLEGNLIFLNDAHASAQESPYKQPGKVLRALEVLSEACQARRTSIRRKMSVGNMETFFKERGFDYAPHISDTAETRYATEYQVTYDNKVWLMAAHIVLGSGQPDTCLRIHFFWHEDKQIYVVGHVGKHLLNTMS